ncbi:anti sigma factor C-terminal domain-containing protein [Ureibacillus sp. FSL K6-8385]|uniref:anti sigma factor C-terminal domain-containing protein n=1 Tax=Ureibacillus sp. FSL K6-8385 TaxID=2954684 RepID=UPI00315954E9
MKCEETRKKLDAYLHGTCTPEEERAIEEHLHTCGECGRYMEEHLKRQASPDADPAIPELSREEQRKIVCKAKWKNRFATSIVVFNIFIIISLISMMATGIIYAFIGTDANRVIQTAVQMTMPNVYSDAGGTNIKVFFNADLEGSLQKRVGSEERYVGKYHGKMILNHLNFSREWVDGRYDLDLYFLHPQVFASQQEEEKESYRRGANETWEALKMLPEGTVSELAVSLDDVYSFDEMYQILKDYDVEIVWYAVDTGTEEERDSHLLSMGETLWGIHEYALHSLVEEDVYQEKGDGHIREKAFKNGLALLAEHERWAEKVIWNYDETSIKDIQKYVDEHGVKCYGAVLTGPTKELLKLAGNEHVIYAALGEVDFWNWYNKDAGGALYH